MKLSQFKFKLPEEQIALYPTFHRDECRMMVVHRKSNRIDMYRTDENGEPILKEDGTPEFIEDPNRGLYSYEALKSRLVSGRYETGYDNYLGPVINLRPLSNEEIFVLLRTVKGLHEQRYGYTSDIDDRKLEIYLKTVLSGSVSSSMLTPREITRDLISLLDTLHQNPQARFSKLVESRTVDADRDPDNDIIEDLDV